MRNPEIPGREISAKALVLCGPSLDPASLCGVTRCDAESRNTRAVIPHLMRNPGIPANGPRIVVRGDPVRRGIQEYPGGHSALDAESRNTGKGNTHKRPLTGPRIGCGVTWCDAVSRNTRAVIPHLMRNPEIPANGPRIVVRGDSRTGPRIAVRGDPVRRGIQEYPPVGPLNGTVPIDNHRLRLEYIRELHQSPPTSPSTAGFPVR